MDKFNLASFLPSRSAAGWFLKLKLHLAQTKSRDQLQIQIDTAGKITHKQIIRMHESQRKRV